MRVAKFANVHTTAGKKAIAFLKGNFFVKCLIYEVEVTTENSSQIPIMTLVKRNSNLTITLTRSPSKKDIINIIL